MKKSLKKVVALVSLVMCTSCIMVTPLNASATSTYLQGDVNGDGSVNVSDTQLARQFLQGMKGANGSTAERLDADRNGIIDENDVNKIRNIVLHIETGDTFTSQSNFYLPSQESRTYYVYNASTGVQKTSETYTLSPVANISATSTRSIIGEDSRVLEPGLTGVIRFNNGATQFTGVVVDSHTILTVAHGIFDEDNKVCYTNFQAFFYDEEQHIMDVPITLNEVHIPYSYISNVDDLDDYSFERYDYALITVNEDLSQYINFNVGVADSYISSFNYDFYVTGFASSPFEVGSAELVNRKSTGTGKMCSTTNYNLYYNIDTVGGYSGAPIYLDVNGSKTIVGINAYSLYDHENHSNFNHGTRITTNILHFIYNNPNL